MLTLTSVYQKSKKSNQSGKDKIYIQRLLRSPTIKNYKSVRERNNKKTDKRKAST